ncbi:MAG: glycerate kinase [bacterium]
MGTGVEELRILVAPDSFKGSLSAAAAAGAIAAGIRRVWPTAAIEELPLADGGEGTVDALIAATGGQRRRRTVQDPLGRPVEAEFGILGDGRTAVMEMAAASGLTLLAPAERNPLTASTYGTGELLRAALDAGCRKIIIGIGGSATNDGGAGMASALGARLFDGEGAELPPGGAALGRLAGIDTGNLDARLRETEIIIASDVDNPLCGPRGASFVYGPQKGATAAMAELLDRSLARYGACLAALTGRNVAEQPGAGAAGGLGAGLLALTGGRLQPGIDVVVAAVGLAERLASKDLAITGEGSLDSQTMYGKVPYGVARLARRCGVPVIAVAGRVAADFPFAACGLAGAMSLPPGPVALSEAMLRAEEYTALAAERAARLMELGRQIGRSQKREVK